MKKNALKIVKIDKNKSLFNYEKKIIIHELISIILIITAGIFTLISWP
mgnify:CR=1 FL=1